MDVERWALGASAQKGKLKVGRREGGREGWTRWRMERETEEGGREGGTCMTCLSLTGIEGWNSGRRQRMVGGGGGGREGGREGEQGSKGNTLYDSTARSSYTRKGGREGRRREKREFAEWWGGQEG